MTNDRTFTMIKPLAVKSGHTGKIIDRILEEGYTITALKMVQLCKREAEEFYAIHREQPFFETLTNYMASGPVVAAVLRKENAVSDYRKLIGATNPAQAEPGTLRHSFGTDVTRNAVHGSDSDENALNESRFFFARLEELIA